MNNTHIVILAGGKGERLWPLSRKQNPKQLLSFINQRTLLEHTIDRISSLVEKSHIHVVTTQEQSDQIETLIGDRIGSIIIEPASCNTAPAILLSCLHIEKTDPNATIAFLAADHFIPNTQSFCTHLQKALKHSNEHPVITLLGIKPTWPATGYGYIEYTKQNETEVCPVKRFHEKPNEDVAKLYYESDTMLWNAGMFCGNAKTFLDEYEQHASAMVKQMQSYLDGKGNYEDIENTSFDYAILEKSTTSCVLPSDFSWSDVGNLDTFLSLLQIPHISHDNVIEIESSNNIVLVEDKLTALIGVENICVVQTDDVLLIAKRDDVEKVKLVLRQLKNNKLEHYL